MRPNDSSNGGIEFSALLAKGVDFVSDGVAGTLCGNSNAVFEVRELLRGVKLSRMSGQEVLIEEGGELLRFQDFEGNWLSGRSKGGFELKEDGDRGMVGDASFVKGCRGGFGESSGVDEGDKP